MKKFLIFSFAFIFAITPFFAVNFALAASTYVDTNISFNQGLTNGGVAVDTSRSNPSKALGIEDGDFVSLGFGGEIVLAFPISLGGGALAITAFERTDGDYPLEKAQVSVSKDGLNWVLLGTANNDSEEPVQTFELRDFCVKYVKLLDVTEAGAHNDSADGYDLDAVRGDYEFECQPEEPKEPCDDECESGHDIVINDNSAFIMNRVSANSNTGGNTAKGSYGGDGGNAGDIEAGDVDESSTGNGGNGGDASTGGTVVSGDATSVVDLTNEINSNRTIVDRCACETDECCGDGGHVLVFNRNRVLMMNDAEANSNTGDNYAKGSYAGEGGNGGDIGDSKNYHGNNVEKSSSGNGNHQEADTEVEESNTGDGGMGGNAGEGGLVQSGDSISRTTVVNVINRTITRIFR